MEPVFQTDTVTNAFSTVDADGVTVDADSGDAEIDWNEIPVVEIDAPPYETAFDSNQFYKFEDATIARPIIQYYRSRDGDLVTRQKPAAELDAAAWSANNAPYTLDHPNTGVVKDVADVHGFWRDPHYDADAEALQASLYVPVNDDGATEYLSESADLSVGFYNQRQQTYDGSVGSLTDETPEQYQTNILFDHIASVEQGRCPSSEGCGIAADSSTSFFTKKDQTMQTGSWVKWDASGGTAYGKIDEVIEDGCTSRGKGDMEVCADDDDPATVVEVYDDESGESKDEFVRHKMSELRSWSGPTTDAMEMNIESTLTQGAVVRWDAIDGLTGYIVHAPRNEPYYMVNLLMEEGDGWRDTKRTLTVGISDVWGLKENDEQVWVWDVAPELSKGDVMGDMEMESDYREDDEYYAIGPDENPDDEPKYPINNCNDATDAWNLRGQGDYDISRDELESRIKSRANELDCDLPSTADQDSGCGCGDSGPTNDHYTEDYYTHRDDTMTDDPTDGFEISVAVDESNVTIDSLAEQFDAVADLKAERDALEDDIVEVRDAMDLDADECPCDHIGDVVDQAERVEELEEDLEAYRIEEKEDALDELVEYGADREQWEDEDLDTISEEIDRREEVLEGVDMSVKNADTPSEETETNTDSGETTRNGTRRFGRGYNAT